MAFGPTVEPMTGLSQMLGYSQQEPRNSAMALMDPIGGTTAVTALLTALREREQTARGAYVELSLHECGVTFNGPWLIERQLGGELGPQGNRHPEMAPHGMYRCRSRNLADDADWVAVACQDQCAWQGLVSLLGSELDPGWGLAERVARAATIDAALQDWSLGLDKDAAAEALQQAGVAAGPVATAPDMLAEPQAQAREFFAIYERFATPIPGNPHPHVGSVLQRLDTVSALGSAQPERIAAMAQHVVTEDSAIARYEHNCRTATGLIFLPSSGVGHG